MRVFVRTADQTKNHLKKCFKITDERMSKLELEWKATDDIYQCSSSNTPSGGFDSATGVSIYFGAMNDNSEDINMQTTKGLHACLFLHSKLCISEPQVVIQPTNRDFRNVQAKKFAQTYVNALRKNKNLQRKLASGPYLSCVYRGTGILFIGWDSNGGRIVKAGEGETFNPQTDEIKMEGDHDIRNVDVRNFRIDPTCQGIMDDANWCIESHSMPIEEAVYEYPNHKDAILAYAKDRSSKEQVDAQFNSNNGSSEDDVYEVVIHHYWERARPFNGMTGSHIVFINREDPILLKSGPNPYEHGRLPFAILTDITILNNIHGMSRLVPIIPILEAKNSFYTAVQKNIEEHGVSRIMVPEGAVSDEALSSDSACIIEYNASTGGKPEHIKAQSVTQDIFQQNTVYDREIESIFGMSEFSQGEIPRELSAYAVLQSIEQDDKFRIDLFNKKKDFVVDTLTMMLQNTKQFVTIPRALEISGAENICGVEYFKGSDLNGEWTVTADYGSYLPVDPAARKGQVLELLKTGALEKAGIDAKKMILTLVDGDMIDIKQTLESAQQRQNEEIMGMINGVQVNVEEWDEHTAHMLVIQEYAQSSDFKALDRSTKEKIWGHWKDHRDALAKLQAAAQPQQPPMEGAPGEAPEAIPGVGQPGLTGEAPGVPAANVAKPETGPAGAEPVGLSGLAP